MRKNKENGVGEPGQFKTTAVLGFTPTDHTPSESPATKKGEASKKIHPRGNSGDKEQSKRVRIHHRKGGE